MRQKTLFQITSVSLVFAALFARVCLFIKQNVPDLFYFDEWDFWGGIFSPTSAWAQFRWQHGSHRMGIGYWILRTHASLSDWTGAGLGYWMAVLLLAAGLIAYSLKLRLVGRPQWSDLLLPFLFLNLFQWELFMGSPNPAHGSAPLLLVMLAAASVTLASPRWRYLFLLVLNFLALHTGFGYFLGVALPLLMLLEIYARKRSHQPIRWETVALAGFLASMAYFFYDYVSLTQTEKPTLTWAALVQLPFFMAGLFSRALGASRLNALGIIGFLAGIALIRLAWQSARRLARPKRYARPALDRALFILSTFTLGFAASCAVGRLGLSGVSGGVVSRYVPYVTPGLLALYIDFVSRPHQVFMRRIAAAIAILFLFFNFYGSNRDTRMIAFYREGKRKWANCYRTHGDIAFCDKTTGFMIHPDPTSTHLAEKLEFLRTQKRNLFAPNATHD